MLVLTWATAYFDVSDSFFWWKKISTLCKLRFCPWSPFWTHLASHIAPLQHLKQCTSNICPHIFLFNRSLGSLRAENMSLNFWCNRLGVEFRSLGNYFSQAAPTWKSQGCPTSCKGWLSHQVSLELLQVPPTQQSVLCSWFFWEQLFPFIADLLTASGKKNGGDVGIC